MDDHIIRIQSNWESLRMTVDLKELAASAGVRKNLKRYTLGMPDGEYSDKVISVPIPRAKKLLQLIRKHGTEDDFRKCDEYLRPNVRLYKYWGTIR